EKESVDFYRNKILQMSYTNQALYDNCGGSRNKKKSK
ncbi:hypothetical protein M121_1676, partial [Bacteroides fragilis str. 3783N2-1]